MHPCSLNIPEEFRASNGSAQYHRQAFLHTALPEPTRYKRYFFPTGIDRITRVPDSWEEGNFSNVRGVRAGVFEYRINFGPGYRVYFGREGNTLVILLGGGTKVRQQRDIEAARSLWSGYRRRKRQLGES